MLLINLLSLYVFVLLAVAFFSLFERKVMGLIQIRKGPNKVGLGGILQPFADAMKLATKSETSPVYSSSFLYYFSPLVMFLSSSFAWIAFPFWTNVISFSTSGIYAVIIFSLSVYGLVFSGWFSNSNYATIGSVRALVQSVSYEVGLTLSVAGLYLIYSSYSLSYILDFQNQMNLLFPFWPLFFVLFITIMAELNRSPFDLSEGESELVSGFNVEYGGMSYTILFLSENLALLWSSMFLSILFYKNLFIFLVFSFVWVRATLPRVRVDYMLELFWITVLPILLIMILMYVIMIY